MTSILDYQPGRTKRLVHLRILHPLESRKNPLKIIWSKLKPSFFQEKTVKKHLKQTQTIIFFRKNPLKDIWSKLKPSFFFRFDSFIFGCVLYPPVVPNMAGKWKFTTFSNRKDMFKWWWIFQPAMLGNTGGAHLESAFFHRIQLDGRDLNRWTTLIIWWRRWWRCLAVLFRTWRGDAGHNSYPPVN